MANPRIAGDTNPYLIALYKRLLEGWVPPDEISEETYYWAKDFPEKLPPELVGFIGFGCSFGAKWFGGYARNNRNRNYCLETKKGLLKQAELLKGTNFWPCSYESWSVFFAPTNPILIYCDPPYQGTTTYPWCQDFDYAIFWKTMREWSEKNTVIISEYQAPYDFEIIWEKPVKSSVCRDRKTRDSNRTERLFKWKGT
jgi:DNA adenine methylase